MADYRDWMPGRIDETAWPRAELSWDGDMSDEEFDEFLAQLDIWLERGPHVLVLDLARMGGVNPGHIRLMARWLDWRRPILARSRAGTVFVAPSIFMRGAIRATLSVKPLPTRSQVCGDLETARAIADCMLPDQRAA